MRALAFSLFAACLAFESVAETPRDRFSAEAVFNLEYAADPQVSPDGRRIVYVRRAMDRQRDRVDGDLWTLEIETGRHRPLVVGEGPAGAPRWSPDGTRIAYLSASAKGKPELRILFLDDGRSFAAATLEEGPGAPAWSPDGTQLAFAMHDPATPASFAAPPKSPEGAEWAAPVRVFEDIQFRADGEGYLKKGDQRIYVLSAEGGAPRAVTDGTSDFAAPVWLDRSTLLAVGSEAPDADLNPGQVEIFAIDVATGSRRALTKRDGPDISPVPSPNGRRIAYLGYDDERKAYHKTDLYLMDADGGGVRNLTAAYDRAIDAIAWRPDGQAVIGLVEIDGALCLVEFPLQGKPRVLTRDVGGTDITRPYAAGAFSVARTGGARPAIAYTQASPQRPAEVAVLRGAGAGKRLTQLNEDALGHLRLGAVEEITVPSSAGGLPIQAWIVTPPDFKADGTFPLILEIHGGPSTMYSASFAAEIQRFAAEGYVVVYANPRGSTGYGLAFTREIEDNYPGQDHDDLMSVVDAVLAKGYADPKRLFVTGGSGGGVLTAWAVGKTDRFAAAASIKPVINWATLALSSDIAAFTTRNWFAAMPWEKPEEYWRRSPISLAGNVKTPTMLMVGEEDWRTPAWEAEQFYTALKLRQVDTVLVRVPGAPHDISARPSQLIAKVDNIMGWFAKYDPAKAKTDAQSAD